jgi:hypothetical protein
MTGKELKAVRVLRLKYSQAELAIAMQTPKRTLQDLEAMGDQEIRGVYAACIELLVWKDDVLMKGIKEKIDIDLAKRYPDGIPGND